MKAEEAYELAVKLIEPYLSFHGRAAPGGVRKEADLRAGIGHLEKALAEAPRNWMVWWVRGKAEQALGAHEASYRSFRRAREINAGHLDIGREFVAECLETGRTSEAVPVAESLSRAAPKNPGLLANLALAYLIDAQLERARAAADAALVLDPSDKITTLVKDRIEDVRAGRWPQPTRLGELT
jgi:Tfp pilus assembly protein PilF